jgi:hypothetical protein
VTGREPERTATVRRPVAAGLGTAYLLAPAVDRSIAVASEAIVPHDTEPAVHPEVHP